MDVLSLVIEGWSGQEKLIFVAEALENEGQFGPYWLLTAFRPWPHLSPSATRRKARERLRHRQTVQLYRLLVVHDC